MVANLIPFTNMIEMEVVANVVAFTLILLVEVVANPTY